MTTHPKVSVIMNCFNGEKYVKAAIESVYAQTYPNWEIIFLDNASSDCTPAIAKCFDQRLHYFRIIRQYLLARRGLRLYATPRVNIWHS